MVSIGVDEATANTLGLSDQIKNSGTIQANGGKVSLNAKAMDGLFDKAINISADDNATAIVVAQDGTIEFVANNDILNAGTLDVGAGRIEVDAGATGTMENTGTINAGLFNEKGYSFRSSGSLLGGQYSYNNVDGAANLSGSIGADQSDVGNLIVTGAVTLTDNVTFTADSNANGNGIFTMDNGTSITGGGYNLTIYSGQNRADGADASLGAENSGFKAVTGIGTLELNSSNGVDTTFESDNTTAFSIGTMKTNFNSIFTRDEVDGDGYRLIFSASAALGGLQYMDQDLAGLYRLANNIDASETASWNAGAGFDPIGDNVTPFTGTFDGQNHTITGLTIDRPLENYVGLFGYTNGAVISNVGLVGGSVTGAGFVGDIVGWNYNYSAIDNSYATGDVSGTERVGGLVGYNTDHATISNAYAVGNVSGGDQVGGLVGESTNYSVIDNSYAMGNVTGTGAPTGGLVGGNYNGSSISNSYATGDVSGAIQVGGLVGLSNSSTSISNSYATGDVSGTDSVGGLLGVNTVTSVIDNSYASGNVSGANNVGGLVGYNNSSTINNAYATGSVSGTDSVGGLVGRNYLYATIDNSYAVGLVTGATNTGGLVGRQHGGSTTADSFYDTNTSGQSDDTGKGAPKTTLEMQTQSTFTNAGWDLNGLWQTGVGAYMHLIWQDMTGGGTSSDPWLIHNVNELQFMKYDLSSFFELANSFSAAATTTWNSGLGFDPVGDGGNGFTGTFDGNGYTITGLTINRPGESNVGLFGYTNGATIQNVGLVGGSVAGDTCVGGLVGYAYYNSIIDNSYSTGDVVGMGTFSGGLVGYAKQGSSISNSYATGDISGGNCVGGLVGQMDYDSAIDNSYATGNVSGAQYVGGLSGLNAHNSTIDNSYATGTVSGNDQVGGLVGWNYYYSTIDNSYATGNVTATGINCSGGLVGYNYTNSIISNSYATGSVSGENYVGGLVGSNDDGSTIVDSYATGLVTGAGNRVGGLSGANWGSSAISNSYATGNVTGDENVGGLVGYQRNSGILNGYASGNVSGSTFVGGLVGYSNAGGTIDNAFATGLVNGAAGTLVGVNAGTATNSYYNTNKTVFYGSSHAVYSGWDFNGLWVSGVASLPHLIWQDMKYSASFIGGTAAMPMQISNVNELQFMSYALDNSFELTNDIDASATATWNSGAGFDPVGDDLAGNDSDNFTGTFDGQGYTITGLTIDRPFEDYVGLFGYTNGSTIQNVGLIGGSVTGAGKTGALVGTMYNYSTLSNSYATGDVSGRANEWGVGGLVGYIEDYSTISNSYATGNVSGYDSVGGLLGYAYNFSSVSNSYATGNVSADRVSGGLVGFNDRSSSVNNSYATGAVTGSTNAGGLVGYNKDSSTIDNSYATGAVSGAERVGGLVGYNNDSSSVDNSYATGAVTGGTNHTGGLVGYSQWYSTIDNSYATGAVSGEWGVGGLVGAMGMSTILQNSYATGTVIGNDSTGGLVGYARGSTLIDNSYATGNVTGTIRVGGFLGMGRDSAAISDAYATGSVTGSNYVGGLVGGSYGYSTIDNSYAVGAVAGDTNVGGLVGYDDGSGTFTDSFWDTETTGQALSAGGTGKTTFDMQTQGTFEVAGWDFDTDWVMVSYPEFQYQFDVIWEGDVDSNWSEAGNWSTGVAPGATDRVLFGNNVAAPSAIDASFNIQALKIGATFTGTITQNANLAVSGDYVQEGSTFTATDPLGTTFSAGSFSVPDYDGGVSYFDRYVGDGTVGSPYLIGDVYDLQAMQGFLTSNFLLNGDIDASGTASWNAGAGFDPIGDNINNFTGSFDGQNYTISELTINRPTTDYVGLFGFANGATIQNVGLAGGSVIGGSRVGSLVGYSYNYSSIDNTYSTATVTGDDGGWGVGGLVGANYNYSTISNSYATGDVTGNNDVGGLVGYAYIFSSISNSYATGNVSGAGLEAGGLVGFNDESSAINNSYATGNVTGNEKVGGLVGYNKQSSSISNSYATGNVSGANYAGGLAAINNGASIDNSYATGSVTGANYVGGFVGSNVNSSTIENAYATGDVSGSSYVGGLVGYHDGSTSTIDNAYAVGLVTGSSNVGGLVGGNANIASVTDSFWDMETTGQAVSAGGTGLDTATMQTQSTFTDAGWDFGSTWVMVSYPELRHQFDVIWEGNVSSDWFNGANWSTGVAPLTTDRVLFGNNDDTDSVIDANFNIQNQIQALKIGNSFTGTITQNANLTISGDYVQSGSVFTAPDPLNNTFSVGGSFSILPTSGEFIRYTLDAGTRVLYDVYGLQAMIQDLDADYRLNNNIDASGTANWNSGSGFVPVGIDSTRFTGTFDGNAHTIDDLTIDRPLEDYVGLFGVTEDASILDVGLMGGSVNGGNCVGNLVGWTNGTTITHSYATGNASGVGSVGGLVGWNDWSSTITDSYATGNVSGNSTAGGLVGGNSQASSIINSYATGTVTGTDSVGGLVGRNQEYSTIDNSHATGTVSGAGDYVGGLVGLNYSYATIDNSYAIGNVSSTNDEVGGLVGCNRNHAIISDSYATGDVSGRWSLGGLVGGNRDYSNIENSYAAGTVIGTNGDIGGLAGYSSNGSTISDSHATGSVSGADYVAGLVGWNGDSSDISNSYATGSVSGNQYVGGLVGYFRENSVISNSYATGNVTGVNDVGGLVGFSYDHSTISNSYATGSATGAGNNVGGLVGYNYVYSTIDNSYATGSVTGAGNNVGGLVGYSYRYATIDNSYATGAVSGATYVGGLVGYIRNNSTIDNSYATGNVTGTGYGAGGLVGSSYSAIDNSYATGTVSGNNNVGGLVGRNTWGSSISNSYATGNVTGAGYGSGGLVGLNHYGAIDNSYATGSVTGASDVGGLVGLYHPGVLTNNWWFNSLPNGIGTGGDGDIHVGQWEKAGAAADFYSSSHLVYTDNGGWDFNGLWKMDANEYPHLMWQDMTYSASFIGGTSAMPFQIHNVNELQFMSYALGSSFELVNNINASATATWNEDPGNPGTYFGFDPAGDDTTQFAGTFEGNSYTITGLTINRSGEDFVGLFGYTNGATIQNVGLVGGSITGNQQVGGLVGYNYNQSSIDNSYATGSVTATGTDCSGGLVGYNHANSIISNSYATGSVSGENHVGGLVGSNSNGSTIVDSYANGSVLGSQFVGGLSGGNWDSSAISNSYATGAVSGSEEVGGFVGQNESSTIDSSYATGSVSGAGGDVGGLVGLNHYYAVIDNSYATGNVSGGNSGGLVGGNDQGASISESYATGNVLGGDGWSVGGLVGYNDLSGTISDSYATGHVTSSGNYIGGLAGWNGSSAAIQRSYSTGNVSGTDNVGGLVGFNGYYSSIDNSYATGTVTGANYVGGLVGYNDYDSTIDNSYFTDKAKDNGLGTLEAAGISAFYLVTHPVYNGADPWDFMNAWQSFATTLPHLLWEHYTPPTPAPAPAAPTNVGDVVDATFNDLFNDAPIPNITSLLDPPQEVVIIDETGDGDLDTSYDDLVGDGEIPTDWEIPAEDGQGNGSEGEESDALETAMGPEGEPSPYDGTWQDSLNYYFDSDKAMNLQTDVRVTDGEVYVLDSTDEMSFLEDGDSMRVLYKKDKKEKKRPMSGVRKAASPIVMSQTKEGLRYGTLKNPGKDVFVRKPGGEWIAAKDGMVILAGDEVTTVGKNSVEVLMDGGQVGHIEIKGGSLFRIQKAETDPVTGDKTTLLDLALGKIVVNVEKLKGNSKFEVRTPTALSGVRGTTFEVTVTEKLSI